MHRQYGDDRTAFVASIDVSPIGHALFNASERLVLRSRNVLAKRAGALRVIIGRHLANNAPNPEKGIRDPRPIFPGRAVPDVKVGEAGARDIAP